MTAYILSPVRFRAFDKNGQPLIGGQVFAYEAGSTTTEKDTYSDKSMENLNTYPVILDDTGSASIYISGDYFIQIFDADGNLIEEGDGIADAESVAQALINGSSSGSANVEQRVTDLEEARDEHTDQINDLTDTTDDLSLQLKTEVETERDKAIKAAVDAAKTALTKDYEEQIAEVILKFDEALDKIKIPIDGVYIALSNADPKTTLGYGTWLMVSKGRAIVGLSDVVADPGWTKTIGSTHGAYDHKLTVDELPAHDHDFPAQQGDNYASSAVTNTNDVGQRFRTNKTGGDQAHNNVQPSMVFAIWKRTA
jgi:ATP-dependent protease HslVU (ClpYQ) peptidase subunit